MSDDAKDAARYRFLRNTFFNFPAVPEGFTGDVIITPPRIETYEDGIPIMKNAGHGEFLDSAIDAALAGTSGIGYRPLADSGS